MAYDPNPTSSLSCQGDNLRDYIRAKPGQWFVGVLDTCNKKVYILPIDVQGSEGARNNNAARSHNRYASGVLANTPGSETATGGTVNVHQTTAWESCNANWMATAPGSTTHEKVQILYGLNQDDLLGFSLIKVSDGTDQSGGFATLKCSSNTLNNRVGPSDADCGFPTHSFSRSTHDQRPGFTPGTTQMPSGWSDQLVEYFKHSDFEISNCVKSND